MNVEVNRRERYDKILEIGPIPPPYAGWGVRIGYLLDALRKDNVETAALDLGVYRKEKRSHCDNVPSALAYARKVFGYLRRGYRIHTHLNGESVKAYALVFYSTFLSWLFRRRAVLTWHGGLGYRWFPECNSWWIKLVHKMIFRMSDRIICNDDAVKRHIVKFGVPDKKVISLPAFSRQYLDFQETELPGLVETFLTGHRPVLFCYAYFRPEFYLDQLIEAICKVVVNHPNLGLLLVGYDAGSESIRAKVVEAKLERHVCFAGDLDRSAFLTALSRADVCIRTHQRDGISSSVLEALSLGIPVVAAANSMRPAEVIGYRADDPNDLARCVQGVLALEREQRRPQNANIPDTIATEVEILMTNRTDRPS